MRAEERAQQSEATISMLELMCSPTLRYPLLIGVVMQLSQQLSGINAVCNSSVYKDIAPPVLVLLSRLHVLFVSLFRCCIIQLGCFKKQVYLKTLPSLWLSVSGLLWSPWPWSPYPWWIVWAEELCIYMVWVACSSFQYSLQYHSWPK